MLQYRPLENKDFSGGITDNILHGRPNQYQRADNLLITDTNPPGLIQRDGSEIWDDTNYQIPAGVQRIGAFIEHAGELFVQSSRNLYYIDTTWQTLQGTSSNPVFSAGSTANYVDHAIWNDQLIVTNDAWSSPMKIYKDGSSVWQVRNAGLPKIATATITPDINDSKSYVYHFCYYYTYTVGTVTYADYGATKVVSVASAADMSATGHYNQISNLPVISNGSTGNYDTSNIKIYIYRTEDAGQVPYYVGSVTNGTTTFEDTVTDATLIGNTIIYTEGGVYDNDPTPFAKYVTVANDIVWYAHVKEGSEEKANRVRQSIKFDPDSCPESFYVDVEYPITGISSIGNVPIVFCADKMYRIEGFYDFLGRGNLIKQRIDDTVGTISHQSIVQTQNAIYFAGEDGFYMTDGYRTIKISDEFNDTYKNMVQNAQIYGSYDSLNNRIRWAAQIDSSSADNDSTFTYDIKHRGFTTESGGVSFAPTALIVYNDELLRADRRGYIFKHDADIHVDPLIDTLVAPSTWETQPIIYDYKSCSLDFGTTAVRKWVARLIVNLDNISRISTQPRAMNDNSNVFSDLKEIKNNSNVLWGDHEIVWGEDDMRWDYYDLIKSTRRFPARGLRCLYKQIQLTNAYTIIDKSDLNGTATTDSTAKTAVLDTAGNEWISSSENYYISFADDNYDTQFLITNVSTNTITFEDLTNQSSSASQKWIIKGYRKNEKFSLLSTIIYYAYLTDTFQTFLSDGSNA